MKIKKWFFIISTFFIPIQLNLLAQVQVPNSVFSNGGSYMNGANYHINSTLGQSFIGKTGNSSNNNLVGFWYASQGFITDLNQEQYDVPMEYFISQNYPNPFNPITKISYALPNKILVELKVFNVLGQEIKTLVNTEQATGYYEIDFNASDLPSGVYLYKLQAGDFVETKKMILLK